VFGTYHGVSTIMCRAYDWKCSTISMFDVEAVPQSWISFVIFILGECILVRM
jgi:hypothetical protein